MSPSRYRLAELDALRGIAVLMVLVYHYTTRFGELFPRWQWGGFALGNYGVHLFFVISGFVIFMTLERSEQAADFLVARFSRLYPAYWTGALVTGAALWLMAGPVSPPSAPQLAINLTMLQGFLGVPSVDGAYWSLEIELIFYAMALAAFATGLQRRADALIAGWLLLAAIAASPLWNAHLAGVTAARAAAHLLILEFAPFFAIGIVCYRLYRGQGSAPLNYALIATALAVVALTQPLAVTLMIAAGTFVLWKVARGGLPLLRLSPLIFLGTISYPLYLVHQKIGHAVLFALAEHGWTPVMRIAAAAGLAIALATAITFLVERPAMRAIRRRHKARRASPKSPPKVAPRVDLALPR